MPDPIVVPQTQKGQLEGFYKALGVPDGDFAAAMTAIAGFKEAANWQNDQQAIFNALGVKDQATAISTIATLKATPAAPVAAIDNTERDTFFALLGNDVKDFAGATAKVTALKNTASMYSTLMAVIGQEDQNAAVVIVSNLKSAQQQHQELVKALGATDHATALTAAADVEKTAQQRVKVLAASAGLPEPAAKGPAKAETLGGEQKAATPRRRLAASINAQIAS